jgi:hypothetical protein
VQFFEPNQAGIIINRRIDFAHTTKVLTQWAGFNEGGRSMAGDKKGGKGFKK